MSPGTCNQPPTWPGRHPCTGRHGLVSAPPSWPGRHLCTGRHDLVPAISHPRGLVPSFVTENGRVLSPPKKDFFSYPATFRKRCTQLRNTPPCLCERFRILRLLRHKKGQGSITRDAYDSLIPCPTLASNKEQGLEDLQKKRKMSRCPCEGAGLRTRTRPASQAHTGTVGPGALPLH